MNNKRLYPDHIYDPLRIELASQLMRKEISKLFPHLSDSSNEEIARHIKGWAVNPTAYHLEDEPIRDFWNIFAAIMESIKLKPSFTALVTAENYAWERRMLSVNDIMISSPLKQMNEVPGLVLDLTSTTFGDIRKAVTKDDNVLQKQRMINDLHSTSDQDSYPIVVLQLANGSLRVMDGNRRALRATLYGKTTIDSYVAISTEEPPRNYWIPVNDLMQTVKLYRLAKANSSPDDILQSIRNTLEVYFNVSTIARINYQTRVYDTNTDAKELYDRPLSRA